MLNSIESALRSVKKADVPESTYAKVDDVLQQLKHRNRDRYKKPKYKKSFVFAAVLVVILATAGTAFATITLWNQQQAKLRNVLNVEGKDIPEYVEYHPASIVPETSSDVNLQTGTESNTENPLNATDLYPTTDNKFSVNVLSSLKDLEFMYYYISVSPVTLEEAENCSWTVRREGMNIEGKDVWKFATWIDGTLDKAYDESSQSLLLRFSLLIGEHIDVNETEPFVATLLCEDRSLQPNGIGETISQRRELFPDAFFSTEFMVNPNTVDVTTISFDFGDGIEFYNLLTGETGQILGAEVSANSFVWIYSYPSMEEYYSTFDNGKVLSETELAVNAAWSNSFDNTIGGFVLMMSDGSTINVPIPNLTYIEDGTLRSNAHFEFPIELSTLESIITRTGEEYDHN